MAGRPKGSKNNTKWIIDEEKLTKGEIRKLNALRKSIGENIGEEAFMKWYETVPGFLRNSSKDLVEWHRIHTFQ